MRLLTWNVNSVRIRTPLLRKLVDERDPDIVCLQETKARDEDFPIDEIVDMGFTHTHFHGMKSYNGVAVLSKFPFTAEEIYHRCGNEDRRHIAVHLETSKFKQDVEIHCLYIPAGGYEPDPETNEKFQHKLDFVDEMTDWFTEHYSPDDPLIALGDFNIAPFENDVWSHKQMLKVVSHTPPETTRLEKMRQSLNWIDTSRHYIPKDQECFTWWSYRNRDWKKSNRGRRLDHIWVTQPLKPHLSGHEVLREARDWERPSDHVPVILDVDLELRNDNRKGNNAQDDKMHKSKEPA